MKGVYQIRTRLLQEQTSTADQHFAIKNRRFYNHW
jgi:hypothetical protein